MNPRTHFRLVVLYVLVAALLLVLVGRMWALQVLEGEKYRGSPPRTACATSSSPPPAA